MATILGLRLPFGYVADRHPGHIAVSLHGTPLGEVPHDIAPRELEARVNRHLSAGSGDVLPASGAPAAGTRFVSRFPEHDRDEADRSRTTPAGLEWLVSHVADDRGGAAAGPPDLRGHGRVGLPECGRPVDEVHSEPLIATQRRWG